MCRQKQFSKQIKLSKHVSEVALWNAWSHGKDAVPSNLYESVEHSEAVIRHFYVALPPNS